MSYLVKPDRHICSCPRRMSAPDNPRVRQSTYDAEGTVWQCDGCGQVWTVYNVVGSWFAYYPRRSARAPFWRRSRGSEVTE